MVQQETLTLVLKYAANSPFKEVCGLVDSEGEVHPIVNVSSINSDFIMSRIGFGRALKNIKTSGRTVKCVYHSHLNGDTTPSPNDLSSLNQCKFDYLIVANGKYSYTRYIGE